MAEKILVDDMWQDIFDTALGKFAEIQLGAYLNENHVRQLKDKIADEVRERNMPSTTIPAFVVAQCIMATHDIQLSTAGTELIIVIDHDTRGKKDNNLIRRWAFEFNAMLTHDELTDVFNYIRAFADMVD